MEKRFRQKLNEFCKENRIILVFLFGSEAKGLSHKESDIGVLFDGKVKQKTI